MGKVKEIVESVFTLEVWLQILARFDFGVFTQ